MESGRSPMSVRVLQWLYVRGAAWSDGAGGGAAAADAALDRQLRLHALPDELAAVADQP